MKTWIAFWNILKKDIQNYYLKPPNISWGIIFPLSWTLMQLIRTTGSVNISDIKQLLPGLMGMSVLFGTTSMLAVTITFERRGRSFDRLNTRTRPPVQPWATGRSKSHRLTAIGWATWRSQPSR